MPLSIAELEEFDRADASCYDHQPLYEARLNNHPSSSFKAHDPINLEPELIVPSLTP